jgi:hypothetical protein
LSWALVPGLLLGLAAAGVAAARVYAVAWRAPVAATPLAAALTRHIARGELTKAADLCRALERGWAADCAAKYLAASTEPAGTAGLAEELRVTYAQQARAGVEVLRALGRMAFPLALGAAIATMSGAFASSDVASVEAALSTALQCLTVGVLSVVFCRASATVVSRQGAARMKEIAAVIRGVQAALAGDTRTAPAQA